MGGSDQPGGVGAGSRFFMTPNNDCLIQYLEARRDMQGWPDEEWNAATNVIDWLKSQLEFEELAKEDT